MTLISFDGSQSSTKSSDETLPTYRETIDYCLTLKKPTAYKRLCEAAGAGSLLIQPRCGVGEHDEMAALLHRLETDAAPDFLTLTIDAHTRLGHFDVAAQVLAEKPSHLNGYPLVAHGWERGRALNEAINAPIEIRHGSPDPRRLFATAIAAGYTSFEGGGIGYNLPYCKDVPLGTSLSAWQEVDRLCGALAAEGVLVDRELFGTLTAVLVPPAIGLATTFIEAMLAVREGVRCCSIALCQTGHIIQDIAALRAVRVLAKRLLPPDVQVFPVFHEFMGAFPPDRAQAEALIFYGALTAKRGGATKLINKTYQEALGIPTVDANIAGILSCRAAASNLFDWIDIPEEAIAEELDWIVHETEEILAPWYDAADPIQATIDGFTEGWLDIPFSASRHAQSDVLPMRDPTGAIRFARTGGLQLSDGTKHRNTALLDAPKTESAGTLFRQIHKDVMYFADTENAPIRLAS